MKIDDKDRMLASYFKWEMLLVNYWTLYSVTKFVLFISKPTRCV